MSLLAENMNSVFEYIQIYLNHISKIVTRFTLYVAMKKSKSLEKNLLFSFGN